MPMATWRGDQCGESVEQFERGEGECGLAGRQGFWEGVADRLIRPVPGKSFAGEGRADAVAQQPFEAGAVLGLDAHRGVQGENSPP